MLPYDNHEYFSQQLYIPNKTTIHKNQNNNQNIIQNNNQNIGNPFMSQHKILTPSIKSFLTFDNVNKFVDKNKNNNSNSNSSTFFSIKKPDNQKESPVTFNRFLNGLLNSNEQFDDDNIEMKNESNSNNISSFINQSVSSGSIASYISKASSLVNINKEELYNARYHITNIEKLLEIEYDYVKCRKNRPKQTIRSTSFFITFVDYYNSLYRYFLLFSYLNKIGKGIDYLLCIRDKTILKGDLAKYHIYVQYLKGAEMNYDKLNTRDVVTIGLGAKKIISIMKSNGIILDEIGESKNKGPYVLDLNSMIENDDQIKNEIFRQNSLFDIENFQMNYILGIREVYYFYGNNIDYFNDILMYYIKLIKCDFDIIYFKDGLWSGFEDERKSIAIKLYFSDENILLEDFIRLITYNKGQDIFRTKNGLFKNPYKMIIITTDKPIERIYSNFKRPNFKEVFKIYKLDNIKDPEEIKEILNIFF